MKRLGIAALVIGAWANTAIAEDYDWSGIYGGVSLGARWSKVDVQPDIVLGPDYSSSSGSGITGGGFIGYNFTAGNWVFGPEVSAAFSDLKTWALKQEFDHCNCSYQKYLRTNATASINARLGYAIGPTLPYITAGWTRAWYTAALDLKGFYGDSGDEHPFEKNGWNVGLGIDYAFTDNLFARAEYRYHDLGRIRDAQGWKFDYRQHMATLGIGYKF
jgi:outer membrane immunogenic protein